MKILFVSAEVAPYVTVGGLSQVSYFLPKSLQKLGNDVRVFTPKFGAMDHTAKTKKTWDLKMEVDGLKVPLKNVNGSDDLICNIKSYQPKMGGKTYFLENREYYELRANVFGYKDDHIRFMLLCKGCLEWLMIERERGEWWPDLIHCNDWHTAYLVELARRVPRYKKIFQNTKIVLTVHNFVYQGNFDFKYCRVEERDDGMTPPLDIMDPNLQKQNALLRGIIYADGINTVSKTHAREVLTDEYGEGLSHVLRDKENKLTGILNGLDSTMLDPSKDKLLKAKFDKDSFIEARAVNKKELQKIFELPQNEDACLVGYVGRLAQQKGIEMILGALPHLLVEYPQLQVVILGGGEESYRKQLSHLQTQFPKQIGLHLLPNFKLPRKIFAGADAILLPSMFEPGGIVALEAMRYGAVPVVRKTGGLSDIVQDFYPSMKGNGFSFRGRDAWALYGAVVSCLTIFSNKKRWSNLVKNCLEEDFSWDFAAKQYQKWYQQVKIER